MNAQGVGHLPRECFPRSVKVLKAYLLLEVQVLAVHALLIAVALALCKDKEVKGGNSESTNVLPFLWSKCGIFP